jgi:phage terminase Nu1 subunit (DNA packaging protein)
MMNGKVVSGKELAEFLDVTPRRIQQLVQMEVIPKLDRGKYPFRECVIGYLEFWKERAEGRSSETELDQAKLEKELLRVRREAIQTAREEESVISIEDHVEVLHKVLGAVRASIISIPGTWGTRVLGIESPVEGVERMTQLADEIVMGVAASAAEFNIDPPSDPEPIRMELPGAKKIIAAGIKTMDALMAMEDFTVIKGIGEKTAALLEAELVA